MLLMSLIILMCKENTFYCIIPYVCSSLRWPEVILCLWFQNWFWLLSYSGILIVSLQWVMSSYVMHNRLTLGDLYPLWHVIDLPPMPSMLQCWYGCNLLQWYVLDISHQILQTNHALFGPNLPIIQMWFHIYHKHHRFSDW